MTIKGKPHPVFAAIWAARFLLLLYAHLRLDQPWFGFWVAFSFFPVEGAGLLLKTTGRDQLSEIITWVLRRLSKHEIPFRGWNNLALIIALVEGTMVYKLLTGLGDWPPLLAGVLMISLVIMLHDHWLKPQVHG